ncbi:MAG TPA: hypothetical protein VH325_07175 [Bryobacteraceae bacterium]|jgi:hypothetical protein|nr:hypothetical protein [Bryobacteraceae bacterium]
MQDVLPGLPDTKIKSQQPALTTAGDRRRTSLLKFYIHDSADHFRIELIGELTEVDVAELAGCWCTAKSSVTGRKLALDVRRLTSVDEAGRQWLSAMVREDASYITGRNRSGAYVLSADWRPARALSKGNALKTRLLRTFLRAFYLTHRGSANTKMEDSSLVLPELIRYE